MPPKDKRQKGDAAAAKAAAAAAATAANREHSWLLKLEDDVLEKILEHHLGSLLTARASCKDLRSRADAVAEAAAADKQHWLVVLVGMDRLPRNKFVVLAALNSRAVELTGAQSIDSEVEFVKRHGVLSALHTPSLPPHSLQPWDLSHAELLTALFLARVDNVAAAGAWHKLVTNCRLQVVQSIAMSKAADDKWVQANGCAILFSLVNDNDARDIMLCNDNGVPKTPPSPALAATRLTAMATNVAHRLIEAMRRNIGEDAFFAARGPPAVLHALCNGGLYYQQTDRQWYHRQSTSKWYSGVLNVREMPTRPLIFAPPDFEQRAALVRQHQDVARACREQARDAGGLPILLTELAANEARRVRFPDRIHQLRMVTTAILIEARGPQDLNGLRPKQLRAAFELLRLGSEPASVDKDELLRELMRLVEHHRQTAGVLPKSLYGHAGVPGA